MQRAMAEVPAAGRRWNVPILILGVIVTLAGFGASLYLGQSQQPGAVASKAELVAAHDLDQRATLAAGDVQVIHVTAADFPVGGLTAASEATGMILQVALKQGQPILSNLVAKSAPDITASTGFLPVKSGLVADTLPTSELVGVAGYVRPGDYIDVIAVVPSRSGGTADVRTIYSGVHVIRTGAASDQSGSSGASAPTGPTSSLTVAVTECQAEFLSWFLANASLKYTLLSSEDYAALASAPADTSCPANAAKGVAEADIRGRWPGLLP
jgi:pilus assembly protein CpaB